jgi:hypothetical protein
MILVLTIIFAGKLKAGDPQSACYDQSNDKIFWFIQASDTHIGTSGDRDSNNLNWLVTEAQQVIDPSFIFVTGDLTDSTNGNLLGWPDGPHQEEWDEYKSIVDIEGINQNNYYDIPGNHDAYNDRDFEYYLANSVQGRATGNKQVSFYKEFDFGKYHFLGVNTAGNTGDGFSILPPFGDPAGLDEDELFFISESLDYNPADEPLLTLAFGHHPLFPTGSLTDTYVYYGLSEFLTLMNQSHASLYGYGHTHDSEEAFFIPDNSDHDGFYYFNVNSLGKSSENQYTIMAVDCNGISSKIKAVGRWPAVLITAPLDVNLGGFNPYAYPVPVAGSNPVRALVFDPDPDSVSSVKYRIDGSSPWVEMSRVPENPRLWSASWDTTSLNQGRHTLEVIASTGSGTGGDSISVGVGHNMEPPQIGVAFHEIGAFSAIGRDKNIIFRQAFFQPGDDIVIRLMVADEEGIPVPDAVIQIGISGPEAQFLTSAPSDSEGMTEVVWPTSAPGRQEDGTALGIYSATVSSVAVSGYMWDGDSPIAQFELTGPDRRPTIWRRLGAR